MNMETTAPSVQKKSKISVRKLVLSAMLGGLAFVLNTFVYFPAMAPFQHFVDVIAAVLVGPWYACAAAALCGILRMLSGRSIQALVGAIFGPILGGLIYKKTKNIWLVWIGEVLGTGILGALTAYPLMRLFYGLPPHEWWYYVPFYIPSACVGAAMGVAVMLLLKRTGVLRQMQNQLAQ